MAHDELIARLPDGYVLVPREPTDDMAEAALDEIGKVTSSPTVRVSLSNMAFIYRAMVAAALRAASDQVRG